MLYSSESTRGAPTRARAIGTIGFMSSTIRWQAVVPPSWVHDLVGGGSPLTYPGHGFVTLEVGWGKPDAYLRGHVPGAVYLDTNLIERPPLWHFVPDAELQAVLERFGITRATTVVLYGNPMMGAARAAVAQSVWLCSRNDVIANGGVLLAALGVGLTGSAWPDILVGLAIAALFGASAVGVIREALAVPQLSPERGNGWPACRPDTSWTESGASG